MRLIAIVAVALCVVGCKSPFGTTNISNKTITFETGAFPGWGAEDLKVTEGSYESSEGTSMTLPDGSKVMLTGGGAAGNLMLVIMQNDGTDQDTRTDAAATVDATATTGGAP